MPPAQGEIKTIVSLHKEVNGSVLVMKYSVCGGIPLCIQSTASEDLQNRCPILVSTVQPDCIIDKNTRREEM